MAARWLATSTEGVLFRYKPGDFSDKVHALQDGFPAGMCAGLRGQRAEKIAEEDCLGQVVTLVTVLPIDPHLLDATPAAVAGLAHEVDDAPIVDGVVREALL